MAPLTNKQIAELHKWAKDSLRQEEWWGPIEPQMILALLSEVVASREIIADLWAIWPTLLLNFKYPHTGPIRGLDGHRHEQKLKKFEIIEAKLRETAESCRKLLGASTCRDEGYFKKEHLDDLRKDVETVTKLTNGYVAYLRQMAEPSKEGSD